VLKKGKQGVKFAANFRLFVAWEKDWFKKKEFLWNSLRYQ